MKPNALIINYTMDCNELKQTLFDKNFEVFCVKNATDGILKVEKEYFDLCIIIVDFFNNEVIKKLKKINEVASQTSIFVISNKLLKKEIITIYNAGADDVFCQPLDWDILGIKMHNIVKKTYYLENKKSKYNFGNYTLNYSIRMLNYKKKVFTKLTPKECDILLLLIDNTEQYVSKQRVLQLIWKKDDFFASKCLDVYKYKLRRHFLNDNTIKIQNIREKGFRLLINNSNFR